MTCNKQSGLSFTGTERAWRLPKSSSLLAEARSLAPCVTDLVARGALVRGEANWRNQ